jgi:hypothetical protein
LSGAAGCGGSGPKYVPVSGVVTLNGKPYPNAMVSFQPVGTAENPNPGRGSSAYTDENGRFTLRTDDGKVGAVVGKHHIRIQTKRDSTTGVSVPGIGSPDSGVPARVEIEPIPLEWYSSTSNKEFDVPPGGTDQANFAIVTRK